MEFIEEKYEQWMTMYNGWLKNSDPRTTNWFLMQSYTPTLALSGTYLIAVYSLMFIMRERKAWNLKWALIFYNFALVALNFHIFYELITATWRRNYSYSCTPMTYSTDPDEMRIASAIWWYYFSKLIEFADTIFFVLRKKNSQVSFLHVYHHVTMFPIWWIGVKWAAGGQSFFGAMLNSFIHVIMYSYYGLAAMGPEMQKYLWWKRYLTKIQLIQFFCGIYHSVQSLVVGCDFFIWMQWALIFYAFTILSLFLNFYFHAYIKPKKIANPVEQTEVRHKLAKNGKANGSSILANGDSKKIN